MSASAIQAAGQRGKVKLVGYDASPKEVQDLKTGLYDALVAQAPYLVGYKAVEGARRRPTQGRRRRAARISTAPGARRSPDNVSGPAQAVPVQRNLLIVSRRAEAVAPPAGPDSEEALSPMTIIDLRATPVYLPMHHPLRRSFGVEPA